MRIAFVAPYQGPGILMRRPIVRNLSLGARAKIELVSELLIRNGHSVEIISQGEVIEAGRYFYRQCQEDTPFDATTPIFYASAVPVRFVNGFWSNSATLRVLKRRHRREPFDLVMLYNLKAAQVVCGQYAIDRLGLPVILEYEDDRFRGFAAAGHGTSLAARQQVAAAKKLLASISGCIAGSPTLLDQSPRDIPRLLLPGIVDADDASAASARSSDWVVFSGTHSAPQGLENLIRAWKLSRPANWQLHIAGHGELTSTLHSMAADDPTIVFRGVLNRADNARMLRAGKLAIVPYDVASTQGFSFKTLECLGAGLHVISTRLSALDGLAAELLPGITFIDDNRPETIADCLQTVVAERRYEVTVQHATAARYGPTPVAAALDGLLTQVRGCLHTSPNGRAPRHGNQ